MFTNPVLFAAVGDVHGRMHAMVRLLGDWERRTGNKLRFVLQVGDFEPTRDAEDLASMPVPEKYRSLGDFADFHEDRAAFPWPVWFVGGNHEPFAFLDTMRYGGSVAHNCHYFGRAARVSIGGMQIAALSGIARPTGPDGRPHYKPGWKALSYFSDRDLARAGDGDITDIVILHEWPLGVAGPNETAGKRRTGGGLGPGNEQARALVNRLAPRLVLAGHTHWPHRSQVSERTRFVGLGHIDKGRDAFAVFRRETSGEIIEIPDETAA
jgi:lariat debranching enzyme